MHYAIEYIGYGKKRRYVIKHVINKGTNSVNGKAYRSEEEAEKAACEIGITISKRGDYYEII